MIKNKALHNKTLAVDQHLSPQVTCIIGYWGNMPQCTLPINQHKFKQYPVLIIG